MHQLRLVTVAHAAERAALSERTIRMLIARGTLPVVRPGGLRSVRIEERHVARLLGGRQRAQTR